MPETYASVFDAVAIRDHAQIVARRRRTPVHVELWRTLDDGIDVLCVVASDRPGLLSFVAASFAKHNLSIEGAQIYTRQIPDAAAEAVDFFWVRRPPGSVIISTSMLKLIAALITEMLAASDV